MTKTRFDFKSTLPLFFLAALLTIAISACRTDVSPEEEGVAPDFDVTVETRQPSEQQPTEEPEADEGAPEVDEPVAEEETGDSGYPAPAPAATEDSGYPGPAVNQREGVVPEPPNPERDLPPADAETATVGGVLIERVTDQGFVPLMPLELMLGTVVEMESGEPAFIRSSSDAPKAELFPTGIFVFRNIPPGTHALVIELGFTQYVVETDEGEPFLFDVEAGEVLDLGQVITEIPGT